MDIFGKLVEVQIRIAKIDERIETTAFQKTLKILLSKIITLIDEVEQLKIECLEKIIETSDHINIFKIKNESINLTLILDFLQTLITMLKVEDSKESGSIMFHLKNNNLIEILLSYMSVEELKKITSEVKLDTPGSIIRYFNALRI